MPEVTSFSGYPCHFGEPNLHSSIFKLQAVRTAPHPSDLPPPLISPDFLLCVFSLPRDLGFLLTCPWITPFLRSVQILPIFICAVIDVCKFIMYPVEVPCQRCVLRIFASCFNLGEVQFVLVLWYRQSYFWYFLWTDFSFGSTSVHICNGHWCGVFGCCRMAGPTLTPTLACTEVVTEVGPQRTVLVTRPGGRWSGQVDTPAAPGVQGAGRPLGEALRWAA